MPTKPVDTTDPADPTGSGHVVDSDAPSEKKAEDLADLLAHCGATAADALSGWSKGVSWTHGLRIRSAPISDLRDALSQDVRSVGMDTHGSLAGTLVLVGPPDELDAAATNVAGLDATKEHRDQAILEIANVLGSAYLNGMKERCGIEAIDDKTFLPSPPGWHQVPIGVVLQLCLSGQGLLTSGLLIHHTLSSRSSELGLIWVPSFVALTSLETGRTSAPEALTLEVVTA